MTQRPIDPGERSGVLHPRNLRRYAARWIAPDPAVGAVVDHYWAVEWDLGEDRVPQRIVAAPAVTLTLERGSVPAPFVLTGVYGTAWERTIEGRGRVFGMRLRPAGLAVLSDLPVDAAADATLAVTAGLDPRLHAFMASLPSEAAPDEQAAAADEAVRSVLADRPVDAVGLLANAAVAQLIEHGPLPGPELASRLGASERTVQRALRSTLGHGPSWVGRWLRLQDVVRRLSSPGADAAAVAAELGYADQPHLVRDFSRAVGMTPGAYLRSLLRPTGT